MTFLVVIALVVAVAFFVLWKLFRGSVAHPANLMELLASLEPVNAASFRHLAGSSDDVYLRRSLSPDAYRKLKKLRLKALRAYYAAALRNSSTLLSYGELLSRNQDVGFAQFGLQIRSAALQLRLALLRGTAGVWICHVSSREVPYWRQVTDYYNQLGSRLNCFCEDNFPEMESRVADHFWP
ncbi:MAG TPA: hypothetical protein VFQ00_09825 [Terriglobales bacterium]|nr:hypothetical protein [Terriglobales bacterium]